MMHCSINDQNDIALARKLEVINVAMDTGSIVSILNILFLDQIFNISTVVLNYFNGNTFAATQPIYMGFKIFGRISMVIQSVVSINIFGFVNIGSQPIHKCKM